MHAVRSALLTVALCGSLIVILFSSEKQYGESMQAQLSYRHPAYTVSEFAIQRSHQAAPEEIDIDEDTFVRDRIKPSVDLPVPFSSQAPREDWGMPFREACEETSIMMVIKYFEGEQEIDKADAEAEILNFAKRNQDVLEDSIDESIEEVQDFLSELAPKLTTKILTDPSVHDFKRELSLGHVLIVPASGEILDHVNFYPPPPDYHMIVVRGYTEDGYFITNEPGTKDGDGFLYSFETVMDAMGDLQNGKARGERKILAVSDSR